MIGATISAMTTTIAITGAVHATSSGELSNIGNTTWHFLTVAWKYLAAAGIGSIVTGYYKFITEEKRKFADEVIKICSEGEMSPYTSPTDVNSKKSIITQIQAHDKNFAALLDTFLKNWEYLASLYQHNHASVSSQAALSTMSDNEKICGQLKEKAFRWKYGLFYFLLKIFNR